jgi:hypothetical protein
MFGIEFAGASGSPAPMSRIGTRGGEFPEVGLVSLFTSDPLLMYRSAVTTKLGDGEA